ncbi:MAG: DUF2236 domain-containing protein [Acidothermus sp.]|nr:DUF2236 domain-containing protein [Acidothermus sp.]
MGYFSPDSVTWRVHSDPLMVIGGLRALCLQALHPQAMRAVAAHSAYRKDPWGASCAPRNSSPPSHMGPWTKRMPRCGAYAGCMRRCRVGRTPNCSPGSIAAKLIPFSQPFGEEACRLPRTTPTVTSPSRYSRRHSWEFHRISYQIVSVALPSISAVCVRCSRLPRRPWRRFGSCSFLRCRAFSRGVLRDRLGAHWWRQPSDCYPVGLAVCTTRRQFRRRMSQPPSRCGRYALLRCWFRRSCESDRVRERLFAATLPRLAPASFPRAGVVVSGWSWAG